jgi:hypothetical protein
MDHEKKLNAVPTTTSDEEFKIESEEKPTEAHE